MGRTGDSRTGRTPGPGSAEREAHTKRQPGQQEQAPPVRSVTPDHPPPGHSHQTYTKAQHPTRTPRDPALVARVRGAHQLQAAEGYKRAAPAALAHGSRGRAGRPPLRPSSSAAAASSVPRGLRVLPAGRPGRRGRAPRAGPGSAGSSGLGRAAGALSPWSVSPRAGPAAPRLLCLTGRPPGAPPAPGPLAGSTEQGAQAPSAAQRRAALPSWGSRPGAPRPRLPGPTTWLCRRRRQRRREEGEGREGERWGGAAAGAAERWEGVGKWTELGERQGVKWEECRLGG